MGFRHVVIKALRLLQQTPGGMTPEKLAFELDKSIIYTKYSIIPALQEISECIYYNKQENKVKWICDEDQTRSPQEPEIEAEQFLSTLEQARPVAR